MIPVPASFRDPAGTVFIHEGVVYRSVNESYAEDFRFLTESGLHASLVSDQLVVDFEHASAGLSGGAYAVIKPTQLPFISYPYEWSFHQLKDAAKLVLAIQKRAAEAGMTLKDASAYNVQFHKGKPVWIDTLSFERSDPSAPWIAYRQFCCHFLAPLALMSQIDLRLGTMSRQYLDGLPLDLTSALLPSKFTRPGLQLHIHMHAKADRHSGDESGPAKAKSISKSGQLALLESLEGTIEGLKPRSSVTEWGDYEDQHGYSPAAWEDKACIVHSMLETAKPSTVWDLGANAGRFSRIAADIGASVIAWDLDPAAVDRHYLDLRKQKVGSVLPLIVDLTNPSPGLGWALRERDSFVQRGPADAVLALALIHHLAIGNQVPFEMIGEFFASVGDWVIVEFIPRDDPRVQRLLRGRTDSFAWYSEDNFETAMHSQFEQVDRRQIVESNRVIYLFKGRG